MRKLTTTEIAKLDREWSAAIDCHFRGELGASDRWIAEHEQLARIEFPAGELMNPEIAGYVWAWKMQGVIVTDGLSKADGFNAQGLEGKVVIHDARLTTALLVHRDLPVHRCNIFA
jgi:hypothetical protein